MILFLKGKQNKKEKPYVWLLILEKDGLRKTGSGSGVRLLIGKVR